MNRLSIKGGVAKLDSQGGYIRVGDMICRLRVMHQKNEPRRTDSIEVRLQSRVVQKMCEKLLAELGESVDGVQKAL